MATVTIALFVGTLFGAMLTGVIIIALIAYRLRRQQNILEQSNKPKPMVVSVILSSQDEEVTDGRRAGNQ